MRGFDSPPPSPLSPGSDPFTGSINLVSATPGVPGDDDREVMLSRQLDADLVEWAELESRYVIGGAGSHATKQANRRASLADHEWVSDERSRDVLGRGSGVSEACSNVEGGEVEGSSGRQTGAEVCQPPSLWAV